ncbi:MAG: nicotinate-nucleotide adenylyltransferase [Fimbriimonadaceae bacterium]|nr:nicotinate-nucleotide adenylyltransferase [Fimbriimonadaceae bacterium]
MKLGIMGGTFDPPHIGHHQAALAALNHLQLDEVIWIPSGRNPLKTVRPVPARLRLEMTVLATQDEPRFSVSDVEITRNGPSYMVETVRELQEIRVGADWWLILGSDSFRTLDRWHEPELLAELVRFAVIPRPPDTPGSARSSAPAYAAGRLDIVPMSPSRVSSTMLRIDLEEGNPDERQISPAVLDYIRAKGLYQRSENA